MIDCQRRLRGARVELWPRATAPRAVAESGDCFDEQTVLDLLGGELPEEALGRAERHLGACEACADLLGATAPLLLACLASTLGR